MSFSWGAADAGSLLLRFVGFGRGARLRGAARDLCGCLGGIGRDRVGTQSRLDLFYCVWRLQVGLLGCLIVWWALGGLAPLRGLTRFFVVDRRGSGRSPSSRGLAVACTASLHISRINVLFMGRG